MTKNMLKEVQEQKNPAVRSQGETAGPEQRRGRLARYKAFRIKKVDESEFRMIGWTAVP
jgi:hypothetical protein